MAKRRPFSCGTNEENPERIANRNAGFTSPCPLMDSAIIIIVIINNIADLQHCVRDIIIQTVQNPIFPHVVVEVYC